MATTPSLPPVPGAPVLAADKILPPGAEFTVAQVAAITGVSDDTVRREVERGKLRATKRPGVLNGSYTIRRESLIVYLCAQGTVDPETTFQEVADLVRPWPLFMKRALVASIRSERL